MAPVRLMSACVCMQNRPETTDQLPYWQENRGVARAGARLTCNGLSMSGTLAPRHEHDIALAGVGIFVLQEEKLVDAVLL